MNDIARWKVYVDGTMWYDNGEYQESFTKVEFQSLIIYERYDPGTKKHVWICPVFQKGVLVSISMNISCYQNIRDIGRIALIKDGGSYDVLYEPFRNKYCVMCYGMSFLHICECQLRSK